MCKVACRLFKNRIIICLLDARAFSMSVCVYVCILLMRMMHFLLPLSLFHHRLLSLYLFFAFLYFFFFLSLLFSHFKRNTQAQAQTLQNLPLALASFELCITMFICVFTLVCLLWVELQFVWLAFFTFS